MLTHSRSQRSKQSIWSCLVIRTPDRTRRWG